MARCRRAPLPRTPSRCPLAHLLRHWRKRHERDSRQSLPLETQRARPEAAGPQPPRVGRRQQQAQPPIAWLHRHRQHQRCEPEHDHTERHPNHAEGRATPERADPARAGLATEAERRRRRNAKRQRETNAPRASKRELSPQKPLAPNGAARRPTPLYQRRSSEDQRAPAPF